MAGDFRWISFYMEFADVLLEYKENRNSLILKLQRVFENLGMRLPKLEKTGVPTDIDPFTVFGLANKGITDANRMRILGGFKREFGLTAEVPTVFDGIPVLNNMKATFYGFEGERGEGDIDNLWAVFDTALRLSDTDTEELRQAFYRAYDQAISQIVIRWNITMGLYWVRPYRFMNLDSRNRQFVTNASNMPADIASEVSGMKTVPSAETYLSLCDRCRKALKAGSYEYKNLPELSYTAWLVSREEDMAVQTYASKAWLVTWNQSYWAWDGYAEICEATREGKPDVQSWACASKAPAIGDEVYLLKIGDPPRGVIGHGTVIRESYEKGHYDTAKAAEGKTEKAIDIRFDRLIDYEKEKFVTQEELVAKCAAQQWSPQSSGIEIKPEVLHALRSLWDAVTREEWWPSLTEYDPGFTAQEYHDLFLDEAITRRAWLIGLYEMYRMPGHLGTCKQIGDRYGYAPAHYISHLASIATNIAKKTGCHLPEKDNENAKYWPILFVGKYTTDKSLGSYCWKMRKPVVEAMEMLIKEDVFHGAVSPEGERHTMPQHDHNLILYGPPGTGKTYYSVLYAVAICEGKPVADLCMEPYSDVLNRYRALKEAGRITFTTFHQSYGYEEFIEGIRPVLAPESGSLGYTIEDGVFKAFCLRAKAVKVHGSKIKEQPRIWGMLLGGTGMTDLKKRCFVNNEIRLGWSEVDDADVEGEFVGDAKASWNAKHMVFDFKYSMEIGDVVVIEKNNKSIDAIGVITGEYEFDQDRGRYPRKRAVEWLVKEIDQDMTAFLPNGRKQLSRFSLFAFDYIGMDVISQILNGHNKAPVIEIQQEAQPYVFIIDEINRGNISKIFGELITLIEETKRAGAPEAMEVTLPYSGEPFAVPENVYILGTMNTADRSIALMDTALRRRFEFEEMMPDPEVLKGLGVDTIVIDGTELNVARMLAVINTRIEYLFDREHTIGHAFFTRLRDDPTLETLAGIFEKNVIPLLQEYFYEDYEKIQLVLGDNAKDDEYKFVLDKPLRIRDVFRGNPDIDLPEKRYSIQHEAFRKIESYKQIAEDL